MKEFWLIAFVIVSFVSFVVGAYFGAKMTAWFMRSER